MKADFDIGNLVYVLLTILFLAIGAFGRKKKPVQQAPEQAGEEDFESGGIRSQIDELFREFGAIDDVVKEEELSYSEIESVESGPSLDVVPEPESMVSEEYMPETEPRSSSNIDYSSQAHSSLDTVTKDEGITVFGIEDERSSAIYSDFSEGNLSVTGGDAKELAELTGEFDARKAFLYSEIFKRKDF